MQPEPQVRGAPIVTGESGAWRTAAGRSGGGLLGELRARDADHFDELSLTALIESTGLRDADARRRYGAPDTFTLAAELAASVPAPGTRQRTVEQASVPLRRGPGPARQALIAVSLLAPVTLQIAAFLTYGISLWASSSFTSAQATTVALATLLSLIATAPVAQAIARRGVRYRGAGNTALLTAELRRLGALGVLAVSAAGTVAALAWPLLAASLSSSSEFAGYFSLLALLWLTIARCEALGMRPALAVATAVGLALVWALRRLGVGDIVADQWIGLAAVNLLLLAAAALRTAQAHQRRPRELEGVRLLPFPALLAGLWPLLAYGLLYFLLIFADRIVAWTAGPLPAGRSLVFRGDYEAGLDCALLTLFACTTASEIALQRFATQLMPLTSRTPGGNWAALGRTLVAQHIRQALLLLAVGAFTAALGAALLRIGGAVEAFAGPVVRSVYLTGSAAYVLLALGLLCSAALQMLACQARVLPGLGLALLIDVVVGGVATRALGYPWATLGLLAGAAAFALYAAVQLWLALRDAPYLLSRALA
jgi:hypothetical protein